MIEIGSNIDDVIRHLSSFEKAIPAWIHSMLEPGQWLPEFKATARDALMEIAEPEEREIVDLFVETVTTEALGKTGLVARMFGPIDREELDASGLPSYEDIQEWVNTPFEDGGKDLTATDITNIEALPDKLHSIVYFKNNGWEGLVREITDFISNRHGTKRTRQWLFAVLQAWFDMAHRLFPGMLRIAIRRSWHATR